jgi:hypothetical protein
MVVKTYENESLQLPERTSQGDATANYAASLAMRRSLKQAGTVGRKERHAHTYTHTLEK